MLFRVQTNFSRAAAPASAANAASAAGGLFLLFRTWPPSVYFLQPSLVWLLMTSKVSTEGGSVGPHELAFMQAETFDLQLLAISTTPGLLSSWFGFM